MARELKVFGYTISTYADEIKALNQRSHVRQAQAVVAVKTKKEAAEKFGISMSEANDYMSENGNAKMVDIAMSKPGQVFAFALDDHHHATPVEIERKPHVPMKRGKRISIEERMTMWAAADIARKARTFTTEELQYLIDMFSGANNPVAAAIAEKAQLNLVD